MCLEKKQKKKNTQRVYAEDPFRGFLPCVGVLRRYQEPGADDKDVRVDSGIREAAEISVHYDPMISKLICHGKTREEANAKMRDALDSYVIHGLNHNIPFLRSILDHPRYISGNITTKFIEEEYPEGFGRQYIQLKDNDKSQLLSMASVVYTKIKRDYRDRTDNTFYITFDEQVYTCLLFFFFFWFLVFGFYFLFLCDIY